MVEGGTSSHERAANVAKGGGTVVGQGTHFQGVVGTGNKTRHLIGGVGQSNIIDRLGTLGFLNNDIIGKVLTHRLPRQRDIGLAGYLIRNLFGGRNATGG